MSIKVLLPKASVKALTLALPVRAKRRQRNSHFLADFFCPYFHLRFPQRKHALRFFSLGTNQYRSRAFAMCRPGLKLMLSYKPIAQCDAENERKFRIYFKALLHARRNLRACPKAIEKFYWIDTKSKGFRNGCIEWDCFDTGW